MPPKEVSSPKAVVVSVLLAGRIKFILVCSVFLCTVVEDVGRGLSYLMQVTKMQQRFVHINSQIVYGIVHQSTPRTENPKTDVADSILVTTAMPIPASEYEQVVGRLAVSNKTPPLPLPQSEIKLTVGIKMNGIIQMLGQNYIYCVDHAPFRHPASWCSCLDWPPQYLQDCRRG